MQFFMRSIRDNSRFLRCTRRHTPFVVVLECYQCQLVEGKLLSLSGCQTRNFSSTSYRLQGRGKTAKKLKRLTAENSPTEEEQSKEEELSIGEGDSLLETKPTSEHYGLRRTVYVKNIPFSINADRLTKEFSQSYRAVSSRILMDPKTGVSLGSGFVDFVTVKGAAAALELDGIKTINGRILTVRPAGRRPEGERRGTASVYGLQCNPSPILHVDNIAPDMTSKNLWDFFSRFGRVRRTRVPFEVVNGQKRSKGYAWVEFVDTTTAKRVLASKAPKDYYSRRTLTLKYSNSRDMRKEEENVDDKSDGINQAGTDKAEHNKDPAIIESLRKLIDT